MGLEPTAFCLQGRRSPSELPALVDRAGIRTRNSAVRRRRDPVSPLARKGLRASRYTTPAAQGTPATGFEPAPQTVEGVIKSPRWWTEAGIEPASPGCHPGVFPLHHSPIGATGRNRTFISPLPRGRPAVGRRRRKQVTGIEPAFAEYETAVLPLNYTCWSPRQESNPPLRLTKPPHLRYATGACWCRKRDSNPHALAGNGF